MAVATVLEVDLVTNPNIASRRSIIADMAVEGRDGCAFVDNDDGIDDAEELMENAPASFVAIPIHTRIIAMEDRLIMMMMVTRELGDIIG